MQENARRGNHLASKWPAGLEETIIFRAGLILVDIGLPLLNGLEADKLVRTALGQTVTSVALTAYSSDTDRAEGKKSGVDCY